MTRFVPFRARESPPTSAWSCPACVFVCQTVRGYISHVRPRCRKLRLSKLLCKSLGGQPLAGFSKGLCSLSLCAWRGVKT